MRASSRVVGVAMTRAQGRDGAVVLGLVAPSGVARELADQIAAELPGELVGRLGDVNWQVRVAGAERADMTPTTEALKQSVRRRMQDRGVGPRRRADRPPAAGEPAPCHRPCERDVQGGTAVDPGARRALGPSARDAGRAQPGGGAARRGSPQRRATQARRGAHIGCAGASTSCGRRSVAPARMRMGRSHSSVRRCGAIFGCSSGWSARTSRRASSRACRSRWRYHSGPPLTR